MENTTSFHSYPSVYALGHAAVKELLTAPVVIQEKIDGSQLSFGVFGGEYKARSKGAVLQVLAPEKMFIKGVEATRALPLHDGWTYRGEYLEKPKHNTLAYDRIPAQHVMLFDINTGHEEYLLYDDMLEEAARLGLECVPQMFDGMLEDVTTLRELLGTASVLGGTKVEGVVVKSLSLYAPDKKRLMGKFVSEAFKEAHDASWKERNPGGRDVQAVLAEKYRTTARWSKAVQHLRERGELEGSPRDIGPLLKEVNEDILKECSDEIRNALFKWAWPTVARGSTRGLPEWYKERLMEQQFDKESPDA